MLENMCGIISYLSFIYEFLFPMQSMVEEMKLNYMYDIIP